MIDDPYSSAAASPIAPAESCFAVTPSDAADLPRATKALYIGNAGDVSVCAVGDTQAVIFRNVSSGSFLDVRARAVRLTGTTATEILGMA
jgi:hypothetical protein